MKSIAVAILLLMVFGLAAEARHYNHGGEVYYQSGYYKPSSDTWVEGHFKTRPDENRWNNLGD